MGSPTQHYVKMSTFEMREIQFKNDVIKVRDLRRQALNQIEWETGPAVADWYGSLNTSELKALAIQNTRGYLGHYHWVIPREATKRLGGGQPFAALDIGSKAVLRVLESARGQLMDEVFGIFDQMAQMSAKLNSFFAHGLEEPKEAGDAAAAADIVGSSTRKVAGIDK